ncbi:MAG: OmpA family protein [Gammaproteobacteria bacterium]|nr:OmpA family protein [Gammaproteobacteria bacterium]
MTTTRQAVLAIWFLCLAGTAGAQDMPGSRDHPAIPRIDGTRIVGFTHSDYDEAFFITTMETRNLTGDTHEGERTRIMYVGGPGLSPLGVLRNYEKAFESMGSTTEQFSCRGNDCYSNLGQIFIWSKDNQMPSVFPSPQFLFRYSRALFKDQLYWFGTVDTEESRYYISVYSAIRSLPGFDKHQDLIGVDQNLVLLEIIEDTEFEAALKHVTAEDIGAQIDEAGHIALYGINFDTDSDEVRADSATAIREIAQALANDASLTLLVVGHTDNQGEVAYNHALSERRAASVVRMLVDSHGIASDRLIPLGVGMAAPVASNGTEDGRALNRRVELVRR